MDEAARTSAYRKDPGRDKLLAELNELLLPIQMRLEADLKGPRLPVVLIVGAPRSGTTLVSQLLAQSEAFGYVNNFVARFWLAPAVGARIEAALGMKDQSERSSFVSEYGVTQGWTSPHEFGYFWSYWFDLGQETHKLTEVELASVDGETLARRIASLEEFYARPMCFKNNTWCTFQADWLTRLLPKALFIVCRRDPIFVAQSLLIARRKRLGTERAWWSVRPSSYGRLLELDWWEQIAAQVLEIEREMNEALAAVPAEQKIEVDYQSFCAHPGSLIDALRRPLADAGLSLKVERELPTSFQNTDDQRIPASDWRLIEGAIAALRDGKWSNAE